MLPYIPPSMMDPERLAAAGLGSQAELVARFYGTDAIFNQQQMPQQSGDMPPAFEQSGSALRPRTTSMSNEAHPGFETGNAPRGGQQQGGGFLSGISDWLSGGKRQKVNQTVNWLQQQGLDEGTARGLAANPPLLQHYLKQYVDERDPQNQLQREKLGYEIQDMREGRAELPRNEQFLIDNGYDPQAARVIARDPTALTTALKEIRDGRNAPRPMSAEERMQWGIPQEDNRPYSMTSEGPKLIGGSGVTVNNTTDMRSETEYDKKLGAGYGDRFLTIQNEAQTAQRALNSFSVMDQMMAKPGFYSGAGGEQVQFLKRVGTVLGMDPAGIDSMETFNALSKQSALDVMGGSLGTGFSNADRDFVIQQVPNLQNTPEGNRQLIGIQRKLAERKLQIARLARQYADQNSGRIDPGFDDFLAQWAEKTPLFPAQPRQSEEQFLDRRYREELQRPRAVNPDTGEVLEWDGQEWRSRDAEQGGIR